jgi:hypothetical protein
MAIDERSRKELYDTLEAKLGRKPADTAMALLPPVGWADVATKQDVELLRSEARESKQEVINTVTWRMLAMLVTVLLAFVGAMAAFVAPLYS